MHITPEEEQELWMAIKDEFDLDFRTMSEKEKYAWERLYAKMKITVLRHF